MICQIHRSMVLPLSRPQASRRGRLTLARAAAIMSLVALALVSMLADGGVLPGWQPRALEQSALSLSQDRLIAAALSAARAGQDPERSPWEEVGLISDVQLARAAALAYRFHAPWRLIADRAVERGVRIEWGALENNLQAAFFAAQRTIIINSLYGGDSLASIGALIAHEAYHAAAAQCRPPFTPAVCLEEEMAAHIWEATVFGSIPDGFKYDAELDRHIAAIAALRQAGELRDWILANPYYRKHYFLF